VDEVILFYPDRRLGMVFNLGLIGVILLAAGFSLQQAALEGVGPAFLIALLPTIFALVVVPLLVYRLYSLWGAYYLLERDGIRLRWGLRMEEVPMSEVEWAHRASELEPRPPLPGLIWPGAVLGVRRLPGAGSIEYMAAGTRNLVVIAAGKRLFAITPADTDQFIQSFNRFFELGSLTPLKGRSVYSSLLISRAWKSRTARILLIGGAALSLGLLLWVAVGIPARVQLPLGFRVDRTPGDLVPAVRLLLLPVLNSIIYVFNFFLGMFLFRRQETQPYAYLLWFTALLVAALFLLAVFFILRTVG
jgi:hypothetical protein